MHNSKDKTAYINPLVFCQQKSYCFPLSLLLTRFITTCVPLLGHHAAQKRKPVYVRIGYDRQ